MPRSPVTRRRRQPLHVTLGWMSRCVAPLALRKLHVLTSCCSAPQITLIADPTTPEEFVRWAGKLDVAQLLSCFEVVPSPQR